MTTRDGTTAVITSAAYINSELAAEFGALPPSFLPLGHKRLFTWQVERLRDLAGRIVLSVPESYRIGEWDKAELARLNVEVVAIPDGLSLGDSLSRTLILSNAFGPLLVLHGDTLFNGETPSGADWISVAPLKGGYAWGAIDATGGLALRKTTGGFHSAGQPDVIATGLFSIASGLDLIRCLVRAQGDFLSGLNEYSRRSPLQYLQLADWLDFGHLQTFYRSRAAVSTARSFNRLVVERQSVLKSGENARKIVAEAAWFTDLPAPLRLYCPPFLGLSEDGDGAPAYRVAYEFNPTLHELFVCGALEPATWRSIFDACFEFLNDCRRYGRSAESPGVIDALVLQKTRARLESLKASNDLDLRAEWRYAGRRLPSLMTICEETAGIVRNSEAGLPAVMHGDFCFPNIFFDFREGVIKLIDPRGSVVDGETSIYGDLLYDLAKLNHSIEGYDLILADRYHLSGFAERNVTLTLSEEGTAGWLRDLAHEYSVEGHRLGDELNIALTIQLFLSMLPLHADRPDRQRAFLANSLRLYADLADTGAGR